MLTDNASEVISQLLDKRADPYSLATKMKLDPFSMAAAHVAEANARYDFIEILLLQLGDFVLSHC